MKFSIKKIVLFSIIFIAIVAALIFFFPSQILGVFFRDIKPIDDSDLTLEKIDVPQEQNAYYDFVSLEEGDAVKYPEGYTDRDKCFADEKCLEEAGKANEENFAVIDRILIKQYFVNPGFSNPGNISIFDTAHNDQNILYISALQPYYLLQKGENRGAIEAAFKMLKIAQKIKSGKPGTIDILVAFAFEGIGTEAVQDIAKNSDFSSADLLRYSQEMENFKDDGSEALVLNFGKADYIKMKNLTEDFSSGRITMSGFLSLYSIDRSAPEIDSGSEKIFTNKFYLQPNKTEKLFADNARKTIEVVKAPCSSGISFFPSAVGGGNPIFISRFWPNAGGNILYNMTVSVKDSARRASCFSMSKLLMTKILLALKAYNQDNGFLPGSLDALVPDYLPELPKDPFSGEALKYSLEKKIIYSVGQNGSDQNLVDDGGDKEKDIVMSIDF
jgi:hypothetical protein